jgi:hypothetical protein
VHVKSTVEKVATKSIAEKVVIVVSSVVHVMSKESITVFWRNQ